MATSAPPLGNLLRVNPLDWNSLPPHPSFGDHSSSSVRESRPDLLSFIQALLTESLVFADSTIPSAFSTSRSPKSSPPSMATVQTSKRDISASELAQIKWTESAVSRGQPTTPISGEAWFARKSRHADRAEPGTASFDEFQRGLRDDHSEHERDYTPEVYDSFKVLDWDDETGRDDFNIGGFDAIRMSIYEMAHHLPSPLSPRVFPVLCVTASTSTRSFVVAQIPLDLSTCPLALYSSGRNLKDGDTPQKRKNVIIATYTAVERVKLKSEEVEWVMATASDAKGWVPMCIQKMGVPGAVVKDVGFFMKWVEDRRKAGG